MADRVQILLAGPHSLADCTGKEKSEIDQNAR